MKKTIVHSQQFIVGNQKSRISCLIKLLPLLFLTSCLLPLTSSATAEESKNGETFISLTRTAMDPEQLPTNTVIIHQEEIQKSGAQNAAQAIEYSPGVTVYQYSGLGSLSTPRMRGFNQRQVVVYIDNRRVPRDVTGEIDLSQIPSESIDRI